MATRRRLTEKQLLDLLNQRLEEAGMPDDFRFEPPIQQLSYLDPDGCNWSRLVPISNLEHYPPIYRHTATLIVREAAREYNLVRSAEAVGAID